MQSARKIINNARMSTFFCFSDECGCYNQHRSGRFLRRHPYYVRATLIIQAEEWKKMKEIFDKLKSEYGIPLGCEIKWSDLWALRMIQNGSRARRQQRVTFLEQYNYHDLIDFVQKSLAILNGIDYKKIFISVTDNRVEDVTLSEVSLLSMHLQETIQRIEMELQSDDNNLGVLFLDPLGEQKDRSLREIYSSARFGDSFFSEFSHIKDSINFENSHHSVGIQISDYIAGSFVAFLKSQERSGYERGRNMFIENVRPFLRMGGDSAVMGYGIREVPSSQALRSAIASFLD